MRKKIIVIVLVVVILAAGITGGYLVFKQYEPYLLERSFVSSVSEEDMDDAGGPFRGIYHIYGYAVSDENGPDMENLENAFTWYSSDKLALCEININRYRDKDISETGLTHIREFLDKVISADKQLIVRFIYDWGGSVPYEEEEPKDLETVKSHIRQLVPILNERAESILTHQGILVGLYGEMHGSKFLSDDNVRELAQLFLENMDSSISLSVRTPRFYRMITGVADTNGLSELSYDGTAAKERVALYNDGMLGSGNDLGTYGDGSFDEIDGTTQAASRECEMEFQDILCRFVPNGGEVVIDNEYNDIPGAIDSLSKMHVSYINEAHDIAVIDKWKNTTYEDKGNAFEYIKSHLGYRFLVREAGIEAEPSSDKMEKFSAVVSNIGFASYYKESEIRLVLTGEDGFEMSFPAEFSPRSIVPGSEEKVSFEIDKKELMPGSYTLSLGLYDLGLAEMIPLANKNSSDDSMYRLGVYTVQDFKVSDLFGNK